MFFDEHELLMIIESQSKFWLLEGVPSRLDVTFPSTGLRSLVTISYPLLQGDMHLGSSVTLAKEQVSALLGSRSRFRNDPLMVPCGRHSVPTSNCAAWSFAAVDR
jgi:hypothetical protein